MIEEIKHISEDPIGQPPEKNAASVRWGSTISFVLVVLVLSGLLRFVAHHTDSDGTLSLSAQSVRLALLSIFPNYIKFIGALTFGFVGAQVIENTKFGQRSQYLLPAILLGACIIFAMGA